MGLLVADIQHADVLTIADQARAHVVIERHLVMRFLGALVADNDQRPGEMLLGPGQKS